MSLTRRKALQSSVTLAGLAAAAVLPGAGKAFAQSGQGSLPAAIAALGSRRREAHPITPAERQSRLERARELMQQGKLDAIFLTAGTSLVYFTGIHWDPSERLLACVLPKKGKPFYVCPSFEVDRMHEQLTQAPERAESRIYAWQENEDPYALVTQGLRDAALTTGRLGMDELVPFVFSDGVAHAVPALQLASATSVTAGCRSVKSPAELALLRLANQVTLAAYEAAWKSVKPGMTNSAFAAMIGSAYDRLGFAGEASCQVDAYSASPHGSDRPQMIREGSIVLIDDGCLVEDYQSDISRTFVVGKATDEMKHIFDVVRRAQSAALAAARPGTQCQAVDAAARKVINDAGFGPGYSHFTHRVGHGIGMDMHEWPYLVQGNTTSIKAHQTFSDEPGIYLRGKFGVRSEDDMHITDAGAELFTPQAVSLEEPFART